MDASAFLAFLPALPSHVHVRVSHCDILFLWQFAHGGFDCLTFFSRLLSNFVSVASFASTHAFSHLPSWPSSVPSRGKQVCLDVFLAPHRYGRVLRSEKCSRDHWAEDEKGEQM
ncbi:hypothetical protein, unlikely [Trypanosoma brucei gambiense DAL972]|uniref:Uncharacterized protein n=1 Tax=Trypanosoma brucei gambiense (strain MHOM/CI/86/DAL972) TaxID=679716 RepID=D0A4H7_TRYB9|nr:hypothetical protein, unlikely [Trypanosoma brucei gambiense DAL972]CBH16171.1 hypothetical protein, unlikely [Trypanosoma brucei gambiense DAL972]|eukprot:XP_011778435.1 hypothetical protein, unlikely [Trypanosoma brucei gambiense DAL972]